MIKYGYINEIDYGKGLVRVNFTDDNLLSPWLSVLAPKTKNDKFYVMPDSGEHVICLMDERLETGCCLGAVFSTKDLPDADVAENIYRITFSDGVTVQYKREDKVLTITVGTAVHEISTAGHLVKVGEDSLGKCLDDLIAQVVLETHPTAMGPSGPPINAPAYEAIKARLALILQS